MSTQLSLLNQPRARAKDPDTSRAAAKAVGHVSGLLETSIVSICCVGEFTAEEVAGTLNRIYLDRWDEGTIRTAVSRAAKRGLLEVCGEGKTSRGMRARLYRSAP